MGVVSYIFFFDAGNSTIMQTFEGKSESQS